jgi:hypothetical protein
MDRLKNWWSARSKLAKATIVVFALLIVVPFFGNLSGVSTDNQTSGSSEVGSESSDTNPDITSIEGLRAALELELGESTNTGVPRGVEVSISEGDLYVLFVLDENLSNKLTIGSAWTDVSEVVKLVQLSNLSKNLTINGTLELLDSNGNSLGQRSVFTANFIDEQVPLLNTDNLVATESWEGAASSFIYHPAIRD